MSDSLNNLTKPPASWRQTAVLVAIVSGAVTAVMCATLAAGALHNRGDSDLLASRKLEALKASLRQNPTDTTLMEQIRQLDLKVRREYFQAQARAQHGGWALLICGSVFLLSLHAALRAGQWQRLPSLGAATAPTHAANPLAGGRVARWSVAGLGIGLVAAAAVAGFLSRPAPMPQRIVVVAPPLIETTAQDIARNWPRFRGPDGSGIAASNDTPDNWDGRSGKNILWKSPVELDGESSPIVWGNKVFLTGANKTRREVYCFDADTGKLLWHKPVNAGGAGSSSDPGEPQPGWAAPTPCADANFVYAIFGNMDLACFSHDGAAIWKKNVGPLELHYGYASSLSLADGKLLVMLDQASDEDAKSKLLAIEPTTGKPIWQVSRPVDMSWTTPIVIDTPAGRQIVTSARPYVIAYDAAGGKEIWRAKVMEGEVAPSPVLAGGLLYVVNQPANIFAIRPDGHGDVTETHVAWEGNDGDSLSLPDIASPLSDGKFVVLLDTPGALTCLDAASGKSSGKKLWSKNLSGSFNSSPSLAGRKLYLTNSDGLTHVIELGGEFKELGRSALGEGCTSSMAFKDGRIYLRGRKNLFCIGAKTP